MIILIRLPPFYLSVVAVLLKHHAVGLVIDVVDRCAARKFLFDATVPPVISVYISIQLDRFALTAKPTFHSGKRIGGGRGEDDSFAPSVVLIYICVMGNCSIHLAG